MSYVALYRKYRPKVFEEVAGQEHITTTLKNQIIDNKIAHAYLFAGTRGTGKTSTAKIFARAVNCPERVDGNPCNSCSICRKALDGTLMDIVEIDAASNRGVDEIRELREKVKYPPSTGSYRVYIVDEVHMLTVEAFNALLKTLEEPPAHVIFILATTEPHKLPATILSRCQRFDFKRIPVTRIIERLRHVVLETGINMDEEAIEIIARNSDGALRDALSLMDQCLSYSRDGKLTADRVLSALGMASSEFLFGMSEYIAGRDSIGCIKLLDRAVREGKDIGQLFKDLISHFRNLLVAKVSDTSLLETTRERAEAFRKMADGLDVNTLIRIINVLSEAEAKAKWSTQPRIYLEVALIKLCQPSMDVSLEGLQDRIARLEDIIFNRGAVQAQTPVAPLREIRDRTKFEEKISEEQQGPIERVEGDCTPEAAEVAHHEKGKGMQQIEEIWIKVLEDLEKSKKGLYTLLKNSRPFELKGTQLVIGCSSLYGIYHDIVNSKENIEALKKAVKSRTGMDLEIRIQSIEDAPKESQSKAPPEEFDLVEEAKKVFGEDLVQVIEDLQEGI